MEKANVLAALNDARDALDALISNEKTIEAVVAAAGLMADAVEGDGKVMSCGNGGSLCDAMHFAEEMTGRYRSNRRPYAALAISDASHMACVGNDYGYEEVFSRYVEAHGRKGDVLLAITTSGGRGRPQEGRQGRCAHGARRDAHHRACRRVHRDPGGPLGRPRAGAPHQVHPYSHRAH